MVEAREREKKREKEKRVCMTWRWGREKRDEKKDAAGKAKEAMERDSRRGLNSLELGSARNL